MFRAGADVKVVQQWGGWEDVEVLLKQYRRTNMDDLREAERKARAYLDEQRATTNVIQIDGQNTDNRVEGA